MSDQIIETRETLKSAKPRRKQGGFARHTTVLFLLLAGGVSVMLFAVKYQVQDLGDERSRLEHQLDVERRAIHVLHAEWSHLNEPKRLSELGARHLGLGPLSPNQMVNADAISDLPTRPENVEGGQ